jgi:hypothetical protein
MMTPQISKLGKPVVEKEIRFAVVMYGGVSLAIYINGVAQELYKMVRATARGRNDDGSFGDYFIEKPESTETVYRKLGELLRGRFVVDILSGTSAGGINAVFRQAPWQTISRWRSWKKCGSSRVISSF